MPQRFGRYEVHDVIGAGGFATVYRATDPNLDATVALKVLADNRSHDPEIRRRFRNEAVLLRRVQSEGNVPGIIEVFDIDETDDGRPYFVMGWADQGTLRERAQGRAWSIDDVVPVVDALAETLGALHDAGVVHRDLTPSNVLLRTDRRSADSVGSQLVPVGQRVVVGDLGLAKDLTDESSTLSLVAGTERYMAPEQLDPMVPVDHRADIFSASTLVRDLLSGSSGEVALAAPIEAALATGMATEPADRHATVAAWHAAVTAAFREAQSPPAPPVADDPSAGSSASSGSRRARMWAAVAGALLVAAALFLVLRGGDDASAIGGPGRIVVGELAVYTSPDSATDVAWVDWAGRPVDARDLQLTPVLPGELTFRLIADEQETTRTVDVVESPRGPSINGPTSIGVGEPVLFTASTAATDTDHYWRDPEGNRVDSAELRVQADAAGSIVIALIAVGDDGIERGTQMRVEVRG